MGSEAFHGGQREAPDATRLLRAIGEGDQRASEELLPVVYHELRRLAKRWLAQDPQRTWSTSDLVHEAYLRLIDDGQAGGWDGRRHFFTAAAEAMRRLLIERARKRRAQRRGGDRQRIELREDLLPDRPRDEQLLGVHEALEELEAQDASAAEVVKLRYFAGLSGKEAAESLGVSRRTVDRLWTFARAWLYRRLGDGG